MLQIWKAVPHDLVEVYKLPVCVVNDLNLRRILGEEHSPAAEERLAVDSVPRNETDNKRRERLLAAVVRNRCFHIYPLEKY